MIENNIPTKEMSYIGSFIYDENINKAYVLFDEGRLMDDEGDYTYEYFLKDHLGNTRVSFTKDGTIIQKLQEDHYYPFGMTFQGVNSSVLSPENKYKYNGKELNDELGLDWYDFEARMYDPSLGRWHTVDPMAHLRSWVSPYSYCQNNPIGRIDPTGALDDWYKTEAGAVVYDESIKSQADLNTKGISGTYLSANKYDRSVVDAIGADIMNSTGKCSELGWNKFTGYVDNPDLGKDYFINSAMQNYNDNASGFMGYLSKNISGVTEATRLSQMTHDWADASGWTHGKNKMEHLMGMFLIADKFGESKASFIGDANEIRGLIINDRQSGQMWDAITGSNNTAFEWRDIMYNNEGISRWRSYRGIIDPVDAARQINTVNGVHMAPWNDFGTK